MLAAKGIRLLFPSLSSSVAVHALVAWMLLLTAKHVIADFFLQTSWMAIGKDQKTGWALPLLAHCCVHLGLTTALMLIFAPRFWFLGPVDFVIHLVIDRVKGFCVGRFDVTAQHQWFWWLIGIDQALHHLTGFGLSIYLAANAG